MLAPAVAAFQISRTVHMPNLLCLSLYASARHVTRCGSLLRRSDGRSADTRTV